MTTASPPRSAAAPAPVALVVGPADAGKHTLARALLEAHDQAAPSKAEAGGQYALQLDTKYYTADVTLRTVRIESGGSGGDANVVDNADANTPTTTTAPLVEALLLAFDAADPASFAAVRAWASPGGPGAAAAEAAQVRLVVACKADRAAAAAATAGQPPPPPPAWLEEALEWCASECFEYVETAAGAGRELDAALRGPFVSARRGEGGDEANDPGDGPLADPHGVPRVKEALEAHLWPGHVRKERRRDAAASAAAATTERAGGRPLLTAAERAEAAAAEGDDDDGDEDADERALASLLLGAGGGGGDEHQVDAAEALLAELAGARERLARLPDAERRAAAAALALRFASALGYDDDGEAGDDDEQEEKGADG